MNIHTSWRGKVECAICKRLTTPNFFIDGQFYCLKDDLQRGDELMIPRTAPTAQGTPTAQNSVELYKTANAQASFICERFHAEDGKLAKIALVIVKRTPENKAETTVKYYLDIPAAKVLAHDLWTGDFSEEMTGFKKHRGMERALTIKPVEPSGYRISVRNKSAAQTEADFLYFDLSDFHARCLAREVIDFLNCYQLATMITEMTTG